jgi:anti-anti-sigma factor
MRLRRTDEGELTHLWLEGMLDVNSVRELEPLIQTILAEKRRRVIIDCERLRMIDSKGVGALVGFYKRLRKQGGTLHLANVRGQPLQIVGLLKLDRMLRT